jgi:hypothetical protein
MSARRRMIDAAINKAYQQSWESGNRGVRRKSAILGPWTRPSRPPKTTRPTPLPKPCRPLEGRPVDAFGVQVATGVRVDRENAPTPDARGAMDLPDSKVGWVNDRSHRTGVLIGR